MCVEVSSTDFEVRRMRCQGSNMSCMERVDMGRMLGGRRVWAPLVAVLAVGCGSDEPPDFGPPETTGSVVVTWSLFNAAGEAITCASLGVLDTYVAVGGEPQVVTCGEEQSVTFEGLRPQRYPVVIRLRGLLENTIPQGEAFDNIVVVGDETFTLNHEFRFDENSGNTGSAKLGWLVDSMDPAMGCDRAGAARVRGETTEASVFAFSFEEDCETGEFVQTNLRPGSYEVLMFLVDEQDTTLAARSATFRVSRQQEVEAAVNFSSANLPKSTMVAQWTVSSSAAAEACREDWSVRLLIQEDRMNPIDTASATAACDRGSYVFEDLPAPVNPEINRYQLTVTLVEELRGDIDRVFVEDLQLFPTETTTVTVDLTPPE